MNRLLLCGLALLIGSVALADAPDAATTAKLQAERATYVRLLDEIPADQLGIDPEVRRLAQLVVRIDRQLAGESDDPLLNNEAIQANRIRTMTVKLLADRAQRAKAAQAAQRQKLGTEIREKAVLDKADAAVAEADQALVDAAAKPADAEAAYVKAIAGYESASQQLTASAPQPPPPPKVVVIDPPQPPVDPLATMPRADRFLLPSDAELRTLGVQLRRQPVKVAMNIVAMSRPFDQNGTTEFETDDKQVRATMSWNQAPPDVRKLFAQRSTGKNAMQVGTRVWVYGQFDNLNAPLHAQILVERVDRR